MLNGIKLPSLPVSMLYAILHMLCLLSVYESCVITELMLLKLSNFAGNESILLAYSVLMLDQS